MNDRLVLHGPAAEIRWSYRRIADLGQWTLTAEPDRTTVTATIASHDAYAVSQQPLRFVVVREKGPAWVWPVESLQIADGSLRAVLGPQE